MESPASMALVLLLCVMFPGGASAISAGSSDGSQRWGYTKPRHNVNMLWWWYRSPQPLRVSTPAKPWPTVLWLQGGPGGSSTGRGNFLEIGPLDGNLQPREFTWLKLADLIFVDAPVGVGFSYADHRSALVKSDDQAVSDLMSVVKALLRELPSLESSPLYLVGESYGGKFAVKLAVSLVKDIKDGTISNLTLGGVVLGDAWISPADYAVWYAQLLNAVSRLNDNAVGHVDKMGIKVKEQIEAGQFAAAQKTWTDQLDVIDSKSDSVNMDNFLIDTGMNPVLATGSQLLSGRNISQACQSALYINFDDIMNKVIKLLLKLIPKSIVWHEATLEVYELLKNDFMKPAVKEVGELLALGVSVTVYQGQLDVIVPAIGVEAWVRKLKWDGIKTFLSLPRQPLHYCDSAIHCSQQIKAYVRSYKNLAFYWILGAGHMVPVDQPYAAFRMIANATQSPGKTD
ncbi:hypothetical protein BS78_K167800 [Paspalum vaginatum]|uniref:Carboxypeptidase n=1 Tax=Paspalum vaginatum TaxID=158149 RepID=A0A9W7XAU9_9POAL|nr:hypothetical protein BS78_K167800 [Paspalum vaginatum]